VYVLGEPVDVNVSNRMPVLRGAGPVSVGGGAVDRLAVGILLAISAAETDGAVGRGGVAAGAVLVVSVGLARGAAGLLGDGSVFGGGSDDLPVRLATQTAAASATTIAIAVSTRGDGRGQCGGSCPRTSSTLTPPSAPSA
jgi:hypothetical protein